MMLRSMRGSFSFSHFYLGFLSPGWWFGFFLVGVIVWDADVEKGCACRLHRSFIRIVSVVEVYKH